MSCLKIKILKLKFLYFTIFLFNSLISSSSLFFFFYNQKININIKISNFFHLNAQTYVFIYLNKNTVKYKNFNFKIWIFRLLIPLVQNMTIIRTDFRICMKRKTKFHGSSVTHGPCTDVFKYFECGCSGLMFNLDWDGTNRYWNGLFGLK